MTASLADIARRIPSALRAVPAVTSGQRHAAAPRCQQRAAPALPVFLPASCSSCLTSSLPCAVRRVRTHFLRPPSPAYRPGHQDLCPSDADAGSGPTKVPMAGAFRAEGGRHHEYVHDHQRIAALFRQGACATGSHHAAAGCASTSRQRRAPRRARCPAHHPHRPCDAPDAAKAVAARLYFRL